MSKKEEEIEKPENYEEGGMEKMISFFGNNIIQMVFTLTLIVWVISTMWISICDIYSGNFEHKVSSYSFILGVGITVYLQSVKMVLTRKHTPKGVEKKKKKSGCSKCGG